MDKIKSLEAMHNARKSHQQQMDKISAVINGNDIESPTAVAYTKCAFGKWLYNEDNHVKKTIGTQFFENIEVLHCRWHSEYLRIYDIFFKDKKKSFFSNILKSKKISEMELDKAKLYYSELLETTGKLLKAMDSAQRRIAALKESTFN